ncbi:hypothetical protein VTN31DRAFT_2707 [Thermomyces dupontii]|uniref:uncharacterized protein n=1 Tax=Talaromyces thermophilus TaxID=28565 RepID=UPI0037435084
MRADGRDQQQLGRLHVSIAGRASNRPGARDPVSPELVSSFYKACAVVCRPLVEGVATLLHRQLSAAISRSKSPYRRQSPANQGPSVQVEPWNARVYIRNAYQNTKMQLAADHQLRLETVATKPFIRRMVSPRRDLPLLHASDSRVAGRTWALSLATRGTAKDSKGADDGGAKRRKPFPDQEIYVFSAAD